VLLLRTQVCVAVRCALYNALDCAAVALCGPEFAYERALGVQARTHLAVFAQCELSVFVRNVCTATTFARMRKRSRNLLQRKRMNRIWQIECHRARPPCETSALVMTLLNWILISMVLFSFSALTHCVRLQAVFAFVVAAFVVYLKLTMPARAAMFRPNEHVYLDEHDNVASFPEFDVNESSLYASIIVPAYEEEKRISKMLDEAFEYLLKRQKS
jgi:hypothetical protein